MKEYKHLTSEHLNSLTNSIQDFNSIQIAIKNASEIISQNASLKIEKSEKTEYEKACKATAEEFKQKLISLAQHNIGNYSKETLNFLLYSPYTMLFFDYKDIESLIALSITCKNIEAAEKLVKRHNRMKVVGDKNIFIDKISYLLSLKIIDFLSSKGCLTNELKYKLSKKIFMRSQKLVRDTNLGWSVTTKLILPLNVFGPLYDIITESIITDQNDSKSQSMLDLFSKLKALKPIWENMEPHLFFIKYFSNELLDAFIKIPNTQFKYVEEILELTTPCIDELKKHLFPKLQTNPIRLHKNAEYITCIKEFSEWKKNVTFEKTEEEATITFITKKGKEEDKVMYKIEIPRQVEIAVTTASETVAKQSATPTTPKITPAQHTITSPKTVEIETVAPEITTKARADSQSNNKAGKKPLLDFTLLWRKPKTQNTQQIVVQDYKANIRLTPTQPLIVEVNHSAKALYCCLTSTFLIINEIASAWQNGDNQTHNSFSESNISSAGHFHQLYCFTAVLISCGIAIYTLLQIHEDHKKQGKHIS